MADHLQLTPSIRFVTIATHSERYFPVLKDSATRNSINLEVLGYGQKYTGHNFKDDLMLKYLTENLPEKRAGTDQPYDPYIVFVDGFDSILAGTPAEFESLLESIIKRQTQQHYYRHQVLVSKDFDPNWRSAPFLSYNYWRVFPRAGNHYINAGMFAGRRNQLINFLVEVSQYRNPNINSNQITWVDYYNLKSNPQTAIRAFMIDQEAELFCNLCHTNTVEQLGLKVNSQQGLVLNQKNQKITYPKAISGPGCAQLDQIVEQMGYNAPRNQTTFVKRVTGRIAKLPYYYWLMLPEITLITLATMGVGYYCLKDQTFVKDILNR